MTTTTIDVCDISEITTDFNCGVDERFMNPRIKGEPWKGVGINWAEFKIFGKKFHFPYITFLKEYINEEETHVYTHEQCYYREFGHPYTEEDLRRIGRKIDMTDKKVHFLPWIIIRLKTGRNHRVAFDTVEDAENAFKEYNKLLYMKKGIITIETS